MAIFPIPPGYSSFRETLKRARHKWGIKEAPGRLQGLLLRGDLSAYVSLRVGPRKYPPETWANSDNDYLLKDPDIRHPGRKDWNPSSSTVFLTSELDKVLPTAEQEAEQRNSRADAPKASANSERPQRGRRPKEGVDQFWIEAARLVYEAEQGCAGKTQQNFIDAMIKWASVNMREPYAEETIETKIKQFWRELKLGGRN